jgi:hypothetical protein
MISKQVIYFRNIYTEVIKVPNFWNIFFIAAMGCNYVFVELGH